MKVTLLLLVFLAGQDEPLVTKRPMPDVETCLQRVGAFLQGSVSVLSDDYPRMDVSCMVEYTRKEAEAK